MTQKTDGVELNLFNLLCVLDLFTKLPQNPGMFAEEKGTVQCHKENQNNIYHRKDASLTNVSTVLRFVLIVSLSSRVVRKGVT